MQTLHVTIVKNTRNQSMSNDSNVAFTLKLPVRGNKSMIIVNGYDDLGWDSAGRVRLTCEVKYAGKVIFPKGQLYGAIHGTSDGNRAKDMILSMLGMEPGEVDSEWFAEYTQEQMDFAITHAEDIDDIRMTRYCDPETGEAR